MAPSLRMRWRHGMYGALPRAKKVEAELETAGGGVGVEATDG
eukprot:CAMPEP_0180299470 /NCGR_PEP_ID=MMETSP0988-20121125/22147_1 /TAXON_ID=697907 /ORGANISM="non described non described, Strain CCMP2293" /LENGTH=41 /DNA_ID= /DNA_START= /DNA_END= /DNA_ORIENTATION=